MNDDLNLDNIPNIINGSSLPNQMSTQSDMVDSKSNSSSISIQTNSSRNSFDNNYSNRPPFPPIITAQDLIPEDISSSEAETFKIPNAYIAYRRALVKHLRSQKVACHRSNISSLASRLWSEESEDVKNAYRKMATDAQMLYNQARGLTFLPYEQPTSTDNMRYETNSENIHPSSQDIEAELLALLQIQPSWQQRNPKLSSTMYFNNNIPMTTSTASFDQFNNHGNNYNGNFTLEQRIQILEQQMALFYQLYC
ncbi:hypothetical protein C1645_740799 [Glomus cerebriforme]|uniref:HMG box domain-containing protein n=1 Tax=Glomus cerebriforme TaxID=658196 RepID=A0A397SNM7_9GLOM|nr:hypothetical protein C1645_740799 [Glomus cerebriforme]